ncbi:hypothetical protein DH2020_012540 [Rehmannia glutinosa]|uniref:C2H2-type domain-containing protein n=1 Tax=Rehmannia glutinosa TaxID=99300 RepID=A0ABR0X029_REHGL
MNDSTASGDSSSGNQTAPSKSTPKKKRNLPGMPDPDSEVIALSPKSLLATNRFVCEICNKGFQRDQNLQLHRRGHNLPWKLMQRSSKDIKKRVYVCPEPSCVHHDPSRALGDLTGIKKHFCRKHGEKKWKCDKCSKKYAVQSDWKAHSKVCGTREYRFTELLESTNPNPTRILDETPALTNMTVNCSSSSGGSSSNGSSSSNAFASLFASSTSSGSLQSQPTGFTDLFQSNARPNHTPEFTPSPSSEPISLGLAVNQGSSIFGTAGQELRQYAPAPQPALSATALLQKAAQMGPATSNASLLRGLGIVSSSSSSPNERQLESDGASLAVGLGLGLGMACDNGSGLKELMLGTPSVFGPKHITLDLLGLGMAASGGSTNGLSAFVTPINAGLDVASAAPSFGGRDMRSSS